MSDNKFFLTLFLASAIAIGAGIIGYSTGRGNLANDCDQLGKFRMAGHAVYLCVRGPDAATKG